ncbi:hypothetical protein F1880_008403 [Penicillium rolfsii]|nr:hypothetical protein F1880_008403 [Penicillium rolfsii]
MYVRTCIGRSVLVALSAQPPGVNELCVCITFGPLFNTVISTYNGGSDSFELSNGFIWIEARLNLHRFFIRSNPPQDSDHHPFLNMQRQMGDKSLLVEVKFTFTLETSTRMKAVVQAELLEVSNIRTTSTHKPINHTRIESTVM